jgi:hypothetical protein
MKYISQAVFPSVGFEVPTLVTMDIIVFCGVMMCSVVEGTGVLGKCMYVTQTTWCHILEGSNIFPIISLCEGSLKSNETTHITHYLRIPEAWTQLIFQSDMPYIFLLRPAHFSNTCSRPLPDILPRVVKVSVSVLHFCPHSSCLNVKNSPKSHGSRSGL